MPLTVPISETIFKDHFWEGHKSQVLLRALNHTSIPGTFLDIGANMGWFTLTSAYSGSRVVAVEPFKENIAILAHSFCLLTTGFGTHNNMRCGMWSRVTNNRGNMYTVCDNPRNVAWMVKHGFTKHDEVPVNRLDSLIAQGEVEFAEGENVVVKIDVEGFEYLALQGATRFLDRMKPLTVHAEYVPLMIQRAAQSVGASADSAKHSPADFLAYMKEKGYSNFMEPLGGPKKVFGQQYEAIFTRQI